MTEPEQLLKLIDGHIEAIIKQDGIFNTSDINYYEGMKSIRWLVYNFLNAPKKQEVEDAGTKDFSL